MKTVKSTESTPPTSLRIQNGKVSKTRKKKKNNVVSHAVQPDQPSPPSKTPGSSGGLKLDRNGKSAKKKRKPKHRKRQTGGDEPGGSVEPYSEGPTTNSEPPIKSGASGAASASVGKKKREKFQNSKNSSLRQKMLSRLSAARFRFINEELYTWDGESSPVFAKDSKSFSAYHSGFKQQTKLWPVNPIDLIIKSIKKLPNFTTKVIADFGCGEAKLAHELSSNKVYSFDLVALNDKVTVADNSNVKLYSGSVDIAVHCLSLMSSKISAYVKEANRVLKTGGLLKIAEVESRFDDVDKFIANVCKFNFKLVKKDLSHNLFYFLDFQKLGDIGVARKRKLPILTLQPCLYKKR